jgi:hypothetical protein
MRWKTKLFIFACVIVLLDRSLAKILDSLVESNYAGFSTGPINYYCSKDSSEILFLGSSRALHHVVPDSFDLDCFVLASQNKHLHYQSCLVDILQKKKKLPKNMLVIHIEPEDFFKENEELLKEDAFYLNYYYDKNDYLRSEINSVMKFEKCKYFFELTRHNGQITEILNHRLHHKGFVPKQKGFIPVESVQGAFKRRLNDSQCNEEEGSFKKEDISPKALRYLNHIKAICDQEGLKLVVFTSPYYNTNNKILQASLVVKELYNELDISYLNYLPESVFFVRNRSFWHDNNHLNNLGARVFSKTLKDTLEVLYPMINKTLIKIKRN